MVLREFIDNLEQIQASEPDEVVVDFSDECGPDYAKVTSIKRVDDKIVIDFDLGINDNESYVVSDQMLFAMSLWEADIKPWSNELEAFNDKLVKAAWSLFKNRMAKAGYYVKHGQENGKIVKDAAAPEDIFKQALSDAKLQTTRGDIAYELFTNHLEESGYYKDE